MNLTEQQRERIAAEGRDILAALEFLANVALERLGQPVPIAGLVVGYPDAGMAGGGQAVQRVSMAVGQARQQLQRVSREPFVARVRAAIETDGDRVLTYYISRGSAAGLPARAPDERIATYNAPAGRLAECSPGEIVPIGRRAEHAARILEVVRLRPTREGDAWDAKNDDFHFESWRVHIESLRRLLALVDQEAEANDILQQIFREEEEARLFAEKQRRAVIDRLSLRDQHILDHLQGEIFRLPLDARVFLMGPPGTGKTTTLIQRLSHKRSFETLDEGDQGLLERHGLLTSFPTPNSWVMFSPTELLKLYLRDAFNREAVPASPSNLSTWEARRLQLARDILGILKSANRTGRFEMRTSETYLTANSSLAVSRLYGAFHEYVRTDVVRASNDALQRLEQQKDERVDAALRDVRNRVGAHTGALTLEDVVALLDRCEGLERLAGDIETSVKAQLKNESNRLLRADPTLLARIMEAMSRFGDEEGDDDDESEPEEATAVGRQPSRADAGRLLERVLRAHARAAAEGRTAGGERVTRVWELIGERAPDRKRLAEMGRPLQVRLWLKRVANSPRGLVTDVPKLYAKFRRERLLDQGLYAEAAQVTSAASRITPLEVDVLILEMLRNAREVAAARSRSPARTQKPHEWLEHIEQQYLMQVFVDEATDFSAVQLACMYELAHPALRSWFACGDLRQRVTAHGLRSREELELVADGSRAVIDVRELTTGYRQSQPLLALAASLARILDGGGVETVPAGGDADEVRPLLHERASDSALADWLSERIVDVHSTLGLLPSIAVFVDGDDKIEPLVDLLRPRLGANAIPVVGCPQGRIVGESSEVRVFDVQHIKGLEFEAVFFVAVDRLAERVPELFDRFLYVGVTRAATFLGVTCEGGLPQRLEALRAHFGHGGWTRGPGVR